MRFRYSFTSCSEVSSLARIARWICVIDASSRWNLAGLTLLAAPTTAPRVSTAAVATNATHARSRRIRPAHLLLPGSWDGREGRYPPSDERKSVARRADSKIQDAPPQRDHHRVRAIRGVE